MSSTLPDRFDFIVVGAGPAGAVLASRLARSNRKPSVLLVEAGGKNDSKAVRADAERWLHRMVPGMNWGYQTAPVKGFDGRVISYDRGKGLGGSSAINFSVWTVGPKGDYDELARLVGDEEWKWSNVQERYKRLETYHGDAGDDVDSVRHYRDADPKNHGYDGPIHVGFPKVWEPQGKELMDIWYANGAKHNLDHNSGDPIGLALCISTAYKGVRSTSADALIDAPSNLHILVDTQVARVVFEGTKASGIRTLDGRTIHADKEVILCAGSLDTPRILLHSGIGPAEQLKAFNIPVVKANDNVGAHLKDHHHITIPVIRANPKDERTKFYKSKELQAAARALWEKDGNGPLSEYATTLGIAYEKIDHIAELPEFQALPKEEQDHLLEPTVPHYEYILNGPWLPHFIDPENAETGVTVFVFVLNQKSSGSVRLQSSDPAQPLIFDPNWFSHPFDRRVAVEATRKTLKIMNSPQFHNGTVTIDGPKSESDEDILAYWRGRSESTWHMMGTARMGKDESRAVVDRNFKVFGVERLRVADMSVIPIVSNNHTQTTAYLTGLTAADKLVREYGLDA
ncbi:glucose-methanol-choline (gmc) oxidoreductase [Cladophialophora carrionii]|uniref:Glucose-methanol-choline (Gmc) oxidoreductase n=1 Tax=Cladophialophora carrionii TaxID=86049 RepID=A0A1C1CIY1_9EURO|nr:glucose-methanol-choline (gmc) oxidoreductase [Cladophialophora carrionii]